VPRVRNAREVYQCVCVSSGPAFKAHYVHVSGSYSQGSRGVTCVCVCVCVTSVCVTSVCVCVCVVQLCENTQ